MTPDILIGLRI